MFSSLSSLLPSGLHTHTGSGGVNTPTKTKSPPVEREQNGVEEVRGKKKEKKDKMANETFIFVRPPPAKSNHPLNLQLQLVPPNARAPGLSEDDHALRRTPSDASGYSDAGASTSSFSSVSTTSTSSSRRMIVPLYNLHAHNVMTNTIVDAGTDAKIARFVKRGIEVIDLALLEPIEVWALTNTTEGSGSRFIQHRPSKIGRPTTPLPGGTPTSSAVSLSLSAGDHTTPVPPAIIPAVIPEEITSPRKRNIFGKIFKKKEDGTSSPSKGHGRSLSSSSFLSPPVAAAAAAAAGRTSTSSHRSSLMINPPQPPTELGETGPTPSTATFLTTPSTSTASTSSTSGPIILPATLGIHPTLSSLLPFPFPQPSTLSSYPPNLRTWVKKLPDGQVLSMESIPRGPAMYVWIVRKWYKRDFQLSETGLVGGFAAGLASNFSVASKGMFGSGTSAASSSLGAAPADLTCRVEVRLEWKKGKSVKRKKEKTSTEGVDGPPPRVKDFALAEPSQPSQGRPGTGGGTGGGRGSRAPTPTPTTHTTTESTSSLGDDPTLQDASKDLPPPVPPKGEMTTTPTTKERKKKNRLSGLSHSSSRRTSVSDLGGGNGAGGTAESQSQGAGGGADPGEESDPEDSETPWVCTLKVRRLRPRAAQLPPSIEGGGVDESSETTTLKLKTATLSPTPHHPKVVAMLKVPFPLPDVSLEGGRDGVPYVIKRSPANVLPPLPPLQIPDEEEEGEGGMRLSAEEIKDVVCSTGFWVVVREGFGGVGRVGRKGDGWRIRA